MAVIEVNLAIAATDGIRDWKASPWTPRFADTERRWNFIDSFALLEATVFLPKTTMVFVDFAIRSADWSMNLKTFRWTIG